MLLNILLASPWVYCKNLNSTRYILIQLCSVSLELLGLSYEPRFHLMICISCQTAISPQYIAAHTRKEQAGRLGGLSLKDIQHFLAGYIIHKVADAIYPTAPIPSITGLKVEMMFKCAANGCGKILGIEKNIKRHIKTHGIVTEYISVRAQAFSKNTHSAYFEVVEDGDAGNQPIRYILPIYIG